MDMDEILVAKVYSTTKLEGEIKLLDSSVGCQTTSSRAEGLPGSNFSVPIDSGKQSTSSNPKSDNASRQMDKQVQKNQDSKIVSMGPKGQPLKITKRKRENPLRFPSITEPCSGSGSGLSSTWICRNAACRAEISIVDTFCKRCSCCICHLFDDNKDPSLWLECASDSTSGSCGSSCHIECALQRRNVGVVDLGQVMQLDGSYCCASCGNISGILGYWKKQLIIAKNCRRVDNLCYRLDLSYRLFDGTIRFYALHELVVEAKNKLEAEVGPLCGVHAKLKRGIVSRLSVAGEVQTLCSAAISKADEISATHSFASRVGKEVSVPQIKGTSGAKDAEPDSTRGVGKTLQLTWVEEQGGLDDISGPELSGLGQMVKPNTSKADTLPDLNVDAAPDDIPMDKEDHCSGGSENWAQHGPIVELPAVDSQDEVPRKRPANTEAHDSDSAFVHVSPFPTHREGSGIFDQSYEYCVNMFRGLQREGHITEKFREKLFTWFSLSSTEHERRVVNAFIRALEDDPRSLAAQLVDAFGDILNNKKTGT